MLKRAGNIFSDTFCPVVYFFYIKVLTTFYLSMGATFIQHSCKAVFSSLKSLDEARFFVRCAAPSSLMVAVMLSIIGTVIASEDHAQLCKELLAHFLQAPRSLVM